MSTSQALAPLTFANGHDDRRNARPFVSVIVPTRNRAATLRQLLDALLAQTYPASMREIIVVDNESTDDTEVVVRKSAAGADCSVRYVRKQNDGPASSRNRGAELARGEILAFTDSDCLPDRDWLLHGVSGFVDGVGVVCGPIFPVAVSPRDPFFVHQILPVLREEGLYPTANVFYRKECFERLGGFDETLRTYAWGQPVGGDDTEFAWRVRRAGYRSAFAEGASIRHQPSKVSAHQYMLNSIQAQILPRVVRSSPEIRAMAFYRRYFVHKNNALFLLFLAGAALSPKRRAALLLTLPWLRSTWPVLEMDAWPPARWPRAAFRLALHAQSALLLEMALMHGSIKHRRLVL